MSIVAAVGRAIGIAGFVAGWALWTWCSGADWRHRCINQQQAQSPPRTPRRCGCPDCTGTRRLRRHVRATLQSLTLAALVALALWPATTLAAVVTVVGTLVAAAGGYRVRHWLDSRKATAVEAGEPIRVPARTEPPADADRGRRTTQLIRQLEAAR